MEIVGTRRLDGTGTRSCPTCADPPYTAFDWQYAHERGDEKMRALVSVIKRVRPLEFGFLHQCAECKQYWVLDDQECLIERVPDDREQILFEWDSTPLPLTWEQLQVLDGIGGTGQDHYGNGRDRIEIPCAVVSEDGTVVDPAILWVTKRPPIVEYLKRVALFSGIATVSTTDYALPFQVRERALFAHEVSMGLTPTAVESSAGETFVLNGSPSLFFHKGIKGKDIRLSDSRVRFGRSIPLVNSLEIDAVHLFAD